MPTISMTSKMTPRIKEWNYMFLKQTSEMAVKSSINDCLGKENKNRIPHLYKFYISLFLRSKNSMVCTLKVHLSKGRRIKRNIYQIQIRGTKHKIGGWKTYALTDTSNVQIKPV